MTRRDDCTQCQEWELCPFHPAEPTPRAEPAPSAARRLQQSVDEQDFAIEMYNEAYARNGQFFNRALSDAEIKHRFKYPNIPADWRLLGPDDPEVSTDMIYKTPEGRVVGVSP